MVRHGGFERVFLYERNIAHSSSSHVCSYPQRHSSRWQAHARRAAPPPPLPRPLLPLWPRAQAWKSRWSTGVTPSPRPRDSLPCEDAVHVWGDTATSQTLLPCKGGVAPLESREPLLIVQTVTLQANSADSVLMGAPLLLECVPPPTHTLLNSPLGIYTFC